MATAGEAVSIDAFHEVLTSFGYGPSCPADEDDCSSSEEQVDSGLNSGGTEEPDGVEEVDSSSRVQVDGISPFTSATDRVLKFEIDRCLHRDGTDSALVESVDYQASLHGVNSEYDLMDLLSEQVTDPNMLKSGEAVLHHYARKHKYNMMLTLLLYSGITRVDVNIANESCGDTPLHIAVEENQVDMVKLLLVFGANPLKKNNDGCTAVDVAATDISMKAWLNVPPASRRESAPPKIKKGERMLFLDGGGMRGLLEIEVLLEIERRTGRRILELFDWIVGTSIGGIIALALVYGNKTLEEIRRMLFRLREVLSAGSTWLGARTRTERIEKLLKAWFGEKRMDCIRTPKVMIWAVNKATTLVQRHCFNNCFGNGKFSKELLWKVARYTTAAAPMYYEEVDNYIDGGFLANNPCQAAWTEIHNSNYLPEGKKLKPSLILSLGSGIPKRMPLKELSISKFKLTLELIIQLMTSTEQTAKDFQAERKRDGTPYFRFNPSDVEVKTLEVKASRLVDMMIATKQYLNQPEQKRQLEQVTQLLVK